MTWPPRWTEPQFKSGVSSKIEKAKRKLDAKAHELKEKAKVRTRDKKCRFPLCGCKKIKLALEVSHCLRHKGMGGNPKGDRSMADQMIYVCNARHRANRYAIDRGTLEVRPLTDRGTEGPVEWWICFQPDDPLAESIWALLAREKAIGQHEPMNGWQSAQLRILAEMES